jgi:uncharacterized membrane protein YkvA (DUF1232 family)
VSKLRGSKAPVRGRAHARVGRARALVRYFRDPAASVLGKLFVLFAVAYVIWPADLIPDVPLVGWLDDLGVASMAAAWLGRVLGRYRDEPRLEEARDVANERVAVLR